MQAPVSRAGVWSRNTTRLSTQSLFSDTSVISGSTVVLSFCRSKNDRRALPLYQCSLCSVCSPGYMALQRTVPKRDYHRGGGGTIIPFKDC